MKKKRITCLIVVAFMMVSVLGGLPFSNVKEAYGATGGEVRGIWLAYVDYSSLGLKTNSESTFRSKMNAYLNKAKANRINCLYFHVRAFDDAAWKSKTFKPSKYLTSRSSFAFDPLKVTVELAHKKGIEVHGWMNPYRISMNYYLDPSKTAATNRIKQAVKEVMACGVDGIHFDDYFYHAKKGYKDVNGKVTVTVKKDPSASKKRAYVNKMVKAVYSYTKSIDKNAVFGISPQGNIDNCMGAGADIKTWLSKDGYIDYIVPQIYWSNKWGRKGKVTMFTDRLKAWKGLNKNGTPMYIGLALYRTGIKVSDDPGWKKSSSNLASQLNLLRAYHCRGYILFTSKDLYRKSAQTELKRFNRIVRRIPTGSASYVDYQSVKISWNKIVGAKGYQVYRAASKTGKYVRIKTTSGTSTLSFLNRGLKPGHKYYFKVRTYRTVSGKTSYSSFSPVIGKTAKPRATKMTSAAGSKKIRLKWKTVSNISGYVIYRATKKSGTYKKIKTLKNPKATTYTNKKLKKGKRYYYKIRTYKVVKGKRIYSNYSGYTTKRV